MTNFNKEKYLVKGIPSRHIQYLLDRVKEKTDREIIFKNLTSDYRNVNPIDASLMLDDAIDLDVPFYKFSKKKFNAIVSKYKMQDVDLRHIKYAFSEINKGKNDQIILQNLTSDLRMIPRSTAENLVTELSNLQGNYTLVYLLMVSLLTLVGQAVVIVILIFLKLEKTASVVVFTMFPIILLFFRLLYTLIKKNIKKK